MKNLVILGYGSGGTMVATKMREKLDDDFRWITPQYRVSTYRHPAGKKIFDIHAGKKSHGEAGPLAGAETQADVEAFDWPDPDYLDFGECLRALEVAGPYYRASGFWAPFFHDVMDLFGMEAYFIKMVTHPEIVQAVTARCAGFISKPTGVFSRGRAGWPMAISSATTSGRRSTA